jgi:ACS family hexuronate transporter-like MFS transporter
MLGLGESANWPGATKAVSEWFPRRERALAVAFFDSGSSIGAAVAPAIVLGLYALFHSWRPVFLLTGALGLLWLLVWRRFYYPPETHPHIRAEEREAILADRLVEARPDAAAAPGRWIDLLKYRQSWGAIASRALTDPVWYFVADWFAIYLVSRGFRLENSLLAFWIPFMAAELAGAARLAGGLGAQSGDHPGRDRGAAVDPGRLQREPVSHRVVFRPGNVFLRRVFHDGQHVSGGPVRR